MVASWMRDDTGDVVTYNFEVQSAYAGAGSGGNYAGVGFSRDPEEHAAAVVLSTSANDPTSMLYWQYAYGVDAVEDMTAGEVVTADVSKDL